MKETARIKTMLLEMRAVHKDDLPARLRTLGLSPEQFAIESKRLIPERSFSGATVRNYMKGVYTNPSNGTVAAITETLHRLEAERTSRLEQQMRRNAGVRI